MRVLKNNYFISGMLVYSGCAAFLVCCYKIPAADIAVIFFVPGCFFSGIAWFFTKDLVPAIHHNAFKNEAAVVVLLILIVVAYLTFGTGWVNRVMPGAWLANQRISFVITVVRKLLVFVIIPFGIYYRKGFRLKDFGLQKTGARFLNRSIILLIIGLTIAVIAFQLLISGGGKKLLAAHFTAAQLLTGIPLCMFFLSIEAGLVEEFFFRGFLQSRLSVLLKSGTGAIILSALIFGLVHAPGLYLRGAASEGVEEQMPFAFWGAYTIVYMSVAGVFLGIIYNKTKNLWLVILLHAIVDLVPNLPECIHTWILH